MKQPLSLTGDPILQLTWRIAAPMSVGMFFNTMFNVVDTACAGLLGTDALAGLSLSFPLFFAVFAVGSGLGQGTTALLANALGEEDRIEARHLLAQSISFAVVVAAALCSVGFFAAPALFRLLGAEGEYLRAVVAYMRVILAGGVFFFLPMIFNSALMAQGETRPYRNFLMAGFVANCLLNPLLMWGWLGLPALGVGGIALATVLVQIGGGVYLWRQLAASEIWREMPGASFLPNPPLLRRLAAQSIPSALNMLTIALGIFVVTFFVQQFGREAVAAVGIATRIEQIVLLPAIGLNTAVLSLVGQNFGAGLFARVQKAWSLNLQLGVALMLLGGVLVWLLRAPAMRLFTCDPLVVQNGCNYLLSSACTLAAYPILFVTVFAMQGLKRPLYGLWIGLYRQVGAPLLVYPALTFSLGWGLWGVWWGVCVVTWSAALFALWWGSRTFGNFPPPVLAAVSGELQS